MFTASPATWTPSVRPPGSCRGAQLQNSLARTGRLSIQAESEADFCLHGRVTAAAESRTRMSCMAWGTLCPLAVRDPPIRGPTPAEETAAGNSTPRSFSREPGGPPALHGTPLCISNTASPCLSSNHHITRISPTQLCPPLVARPCTQFSESATQPKSPDPALWHKQQRSCF